MFSALQGGLAAEMYVVSYTCICLMYLQRKSPRDAYLTEGHGLKLVMLLQSLVDKNHMLDHSSALAMAYLSCTWHI